MQITYFHRLAILLFFFGVIVSHGAVAGAIVNLAFNETGGAVAADASGNGNQGMLLNGVSYVAGKSGNAIALDGLNDIVRVESSASLNTISTGITVAAWVYRDSNQSGWVTLASRQAGTGAYEHYFLGLNGTNFRWFVNTSSQGYSDQNVGVAAPLAQWVHVAGTYDGTTVRMFVNGIEKFAVPRAGTFSADTSPLTIGGSYNNASRTSAEEVFKGKLDDLVVYNRALSAAEIQSLYAPALLDATAPTTPAGLSASAASSTQIHLTWVPSTDNVGVTGYRIYRYGSAVGTATGSTYYDTGLSAATTYSYTVSAYDAAGNNSGQSIAVSAVTAAASVTRPIAELMLNNGSGTVATDSSGSANHGALLNGAAWGPGKSGGGIRFDGVNDAVRIPASSSLTSIASALTVSVWVNRAANQNGWISILSRQKGTGMEEHYWLGLNGASWRWMVNTAGKGYSSNSLGGAAVLGQWVHLTGTYDGASVKLYVNGVQNFTTPQSGALASDSTPVMVGGSINDPAGNISEALNGSVDNVRIYNRALSASEVLSLYVADLAIVPDAFPVVTVTSPQAGANVGGQLQLAATASDDLGVAGVQFRIDGANSGAERTAPPYSTTVDSQTLTNGAHTITAVARDSSGNQTVSAPVAITVNNVVAAVRKVMPLGDSIAYGFRGPNDPQNEDGGYRRFLWERLMANNITDVDMVGSLKTGISTIDRDHEGHNGWRLDEINSIAASVLATYKSDVILLTGGHNDINQGATVATALSRMATLLDTIAAARPGALLLVGSIQRLRLNNDYPTIPNAMVDQFNAGLPALINQRIALGKNIRFIDVTGLGGLSTATSSTDYSADGIHPNDNGYRKMANVWYTALTGK